MYERSRTSGYDWLHFAARSGEEGRAWAELYRQHRPLVRRSDEALDLLRRRRIDQGRASLDRMAEGMAALAASPQAVPDSVRCVLDRWYQGTLGYYHYCRDEHDAAQRAMDLAHAAVSRAISRRRFLLPLANHCHEFRLHQARIERNRRGWKEMLARIEEARGMIEDREPLCELPGGEKVFMSTLRRFFEGLGELTAAERQALDLFFDDDLRRRLFDRFVRRLRVLPGFAITFP